MLLVLECLNICLCWFSHLAVLQLFCSSPKAALRYAAVRTLNKVGASLLGAPVVSHVQGGAEFRRWIMWWFCVNNLCLVLQPYISLLFVWNKTSKSTLQKEENLIIFTGLLECHWSSCYCFPFWASHGEEAPWKIRIKPWWWFLSASVVVFAPAFFFSLYKLCERKRENGSVW